MMSIILIASLSIFPSRTSMVPPQASSLSQSGSQLPNSILRGGRPLIAHSRVVSFQTGTASGDAPNSDIARTNQLIQPEQQVL